MTKISQPYIFLIIPLILMPCLFVQIIQKEKIDQKIQEVINSSDKEETAKNNGLFYQNGNLRVHLIFSHRITPEEKKEIYSIYKIIVEKDTGQMVRAMVPVEEIMELGENPLILFIKIPDKALPLN